MATIRHRKRLGRELETMRKQRGLSQREVASALGWSQPTVGRIEAAKTKDVADLVRQLLEHYEVDGPEKERLLQLAGESGPGGWWAAYNDVLPSFYAEAEDEASHIRTWQESTVPGLLQTEPYSRAIIGSVARMRGDSAEVIDRRVRARLLRRTLLERERPPRLAAVLDEAVLHRQVGGPDVMRGQLTYLAEMARRPHIDLQILPFDRGAHAGNDGRFVILSFDDGDPDLPYVEGQAGAVYLEDPGAVDRLNLTWGCVRDAALSVERSLDLLSRLAKET